MSENYDDPFGDAPVSPAPTPALPPEPVAEVATEVPGEVIVPRGGPIANGRREPIAPAGPLPVWDDPSYQDVNDGADGDIDYSDLYAINKDLQKLRIQMNRIRRQMREAGRQALDSKLAYQRAMRRALIQQTGGSAETRKAAAELQCEALETEMVTKGQIVDELNTRFRSVRDDIENAKVVAYNLRAIQNII
jgi:hypothetical protein